MKLVEGAQLLVCERLILRPESRLRKVTAVTLINEIVPEVSVPIIAADAEDGDDRLT